ncbi:MAG: NAD(+) diphosphatase [Deltaproteobacteria bacterium]|nr:NAD(+) diphosphatase [Deltaproteobacteria bacterium]
MKKTFNISAEPPSGLTGPAWWFVFSKRKMLVASADRETAPPLIRDPTELGVPANGRIFLGTLEDRPCYAAALFEPPALPVGLRFQDLWGLREQLASEFIPIAFRALHLLDWTNKTRFCKRCGTPMQTKAGPPARECPQCGYLSFPRISPAVIVLVEKDNQCLLASSPRFKGDFYSVLAGFAEPGETLEETVAREVREETGIEVTDIRYFGSQPWPFPDSLMIGFTARYAGGEIRVDGEEILDARWFTADQLPNIPGKISIARQLIDWFVRKQQ